MTTVHNAARLIESSLPWDELHRYKSEKKKKKKGWKNDRRNSVSRPRWIPSVNMHGFNFPSKTVGGKTNIVGPMVHNKTALTWEAKGNSCLSSSRTLGSCIWYVHVTAAAHMGYGSLLRHLVEQLPPLDVTHGIAHSPVSTEAPAGMSDARHVQLRQCWTDLAKVSLHS